MAEKRSKGMHLSETAKAVTAELVDLFKHPETMVEGLATVCLQNDDDDNRPITRWSLRNKLIAWANGTVEARTFNQWRKMGVKVNKGSHSFFILGPILVPKKDRAGNEVKGERILVGYRGIPEHRVEDTDFADQVPDWAPKEPPPLNEIAKEWGVKIQYVPRTEVAPAAGYTDTQSFITLCTHDEKVFFHELMHVADAKVNGKPSKISNPRPTEEVEAIAEIGGAVIARMFGHKFTDQPYKYVEHFTDDPQKLLFKVLPKLERALGVVMAKAEELVAAGVVAPF